MIRRPIPPRTLWLLVPLLSVPFVPLQGASTGAFEEKVKPLLEAKCGMCHDAQKKTSGFSIANPDAILAGGNKYGPSVTAGNPKNSSLVKILRGELSPRMPLGAALSDAEIEIVETWIREMPVNQAAKVIGKKDWLWPFQTPQKRAVPTVKNETWVRNPIDAFILQKLETQKIPPAKPAPKPAMARRLYLDLIGVPPSPAEFDEFLADHSSNATEKLIDKLLADPRYGERWARYWLDLVRYAESNGLEADVDIGNDVGRGNVWRYRDWVIDAFNSDMPYDRFVTAQIAGGDEKSRTRDMYVPGMKGYVPAIYYRLGSWSLYDNLVSMENRQAYLDEVTNTTAAAFLGLTMGCARCHDHKYDPIPTKDYYRFQSFFNALKVDDIEVPYHDPVQREYAAKKIKEYTERLEHGPEKQALDAYAKELIAQLREQRRARGTKGPLKTEDLNLEFRRKPDRIFTDYEKLEYDDLFTDADRTREPEEQAALKAYEKQLLSKLEAAYQAGTLDPLSRFDFLDIGNVRREMPEYNFKPGGLFTAEQHKRFYALQAQVDAVKNRLRRWKPMVATVVNTLGPPTEADIKPLHVLKRGDVNHPGEAVEPGFPSAIAGNSEPAILEMDLFRQYLTRGRRVTLAKWLTAPENPLTARVMVNRIWQHHFGNGIVATPSDFGKNGARPSHPELLDWLALQFIDQKWSVKAIHRLILNSNTYQQASDNDAVTDIKVDPDNKLLWHHNRRRLEAEAIRDSILFVSGQLNSARGGPSVFPALPDEVGDMAGPVPIGGLMWEPNETEAEGRRRSIYTFQRRSLPVPMMSSFDALVPNESCDRRVGTTTPLQALTMMNGALVNEESTQLAARIVSEAGSDRSTQIRRLFELTLNRRPTASELDKFVSFRGGLESICQVVLASNEFVYIE